MRKLFLERIYMGKILPFEPGYSLREVSEITGVNHTYLYELVKANRLDVRKSVDGTYKVDRDDLVQWLSEPNHSKALY